MNGEEKRGIIFASTTGVPASIPRSLIDRGGLDEGMMMQRGSLSGFGSGDKDMMSY